MDKSRNASDCKSNQLIVFIGLFRRTFFSWCSGISWDLDGDLLAIICQTQLYIWEANNAKKHTIDVGLRDVMTCLFWSKTGPVLAVGTAKGNLSIYDHNTSKYGAPWCFFVSMSTFLGERQSSENIPSESRVAVGAKKI